MTSTTSSGGGDLTREDRSRLGRRARLLAAASVGYNVVEAVVAITAGVVAGSVALVGFGLDSVVEVSSGLIIMWQFSHRWPETRERRATRLMALSFLALAGYVTVESVRSLLVGADASPSPVGIGLAAASLVVMPFLSWAQRRTGRALGSNAVVADSTQTLLCTYLSAVLLMGLVLNATVGWFWADPAAGLVIAAVAVKEGLEAWRGEACACAPAVPTAGAEDGGCTDAACDDGCCTSTARLLATLPARPRGDR
jgi:divalent metal cation (Fe/Co/Zn/Cd) transporter